MNWLRLMSKHGAARRRFLQDRSLEWTLHLCARLLSPSGARESFQFLLSGGAGHRAGKVTGRGRASKQGNHYLKAAFSQAAVHAVRCYPKVRRY
jgi:Transposase IS116/IS110/IS902 family